MPRYAVILSAVLCGCAVWGRTSVIRVTPGDDLTALRDRIRAGRAAGKIVGTVDVVLAPGSYRCAKPVYFYKADSHCRWYAEKPGTAVFTGARAVTNFVSETVNGRRMWTADVSALVPPLAPFPKQFRVPPGPWAYQAGRPLELARWPNAGWTTFTNVLVAGDAKTPGVIVCDDPHARTWDFEKGIWFYGYWSHDWSESSVQGASYDASTRALAMAGTHTHGFGRTVWGFSKRRFRAFNALSELDVPGEWYLDRERRKLYVLPRTDVPAEVTLAVSSEPFFKLDGAEDVRFEGIVFEQLHGASYALYVSHARDVVFERCTFRNLGNAAVQMTGRDSGFRNCVFADIGGGCVVFAGGDRRTLTKGGLFAESCAFVRFGRFAATGAPAVLLQGCGCRVVRCRIHDAPHTALQYLGNDHLIAENDISRVLLETGDAGAVYQGRNASELGTRIVGNAFRDLGPEGKRRSFTSAVYFDDADWGDDVVSNVFCNVGRGVLIGGGNLHRVRDNWFVRADIGINIDDRCRHWPAWTKNTNWWHQCVAPFKPNVNPWKNAYPALAPTLADMPDWPWNNPIENNRFIDCRLVREFHPGVYAVTNRLVWTGNRVEKGADGPLGREAGRLLEAIVRRAGPECPPSADGSGVSRR